MAWKPKRLDAIASIQTGPFGSQLHQEDYVEVGTPIITVEHLGGYRITRENLPMVSDDDAERLRKYSLLPGDVVVSRVGSVDQSSFVTGDEEGWLFSGRCLRVRPRTNKVDPLFLYYSLNTREVKSFIRAIAVGATMPSINTALLSEVPIQLPALSAQQRIASLLGSLDDKVAANQSAVSAAEQLIDAIVNGSVSGREHARIGDELNLHYGKSLPASKRLPGDIPVVGSGGVNGWHSTPLVSEQTVVVGRKGTIGALHWLDGPSFPIDTTFWVETRRLPVRVLYSLLKLVDFSSSNTDSAVPGLNRSLAYEMALPFISSEDALKISSTITVLDDLSSKLVKEIRTLLTTRDELLPLLMSGKITVKEAEQEAATAGADIAGEESEG